MPKFRRLLIAIAAIGLFTATAGLTLSQHAFAISNQNLVALTNSERSAAGLAPLSWNAALGSSAYAKAQDMCAKDYWAHNSPDGATPWTFIGQSGYPYITAGENLAMGFSSDSAVIAGWMASPGHRANILNADYRDIGVASASCTIQGSPTTLVVAHYGATSRAAAPATTPASTPSQSAPAPQTVTHQSAQPESRPAAPAVASAEEAPKLPQPAPDKQLSFGMKLWQLIHAYEQNLILGKQA